MTYAAGVAVELDPLTKSRIHDVVTLARVGEIGLLTAVDRIEAICAELLPPPAVEATPTPQKALASRPGALQRLGRALFGGLTLGKAAKRG